MSTERHGDVRHVCALCIRKVVLPGSLHDHHFGFRYIAFEDSGVNEKSRFDMAGLVESVSVYL
jgi:hypothetical protein